MREQMKYNILILNNSKKNIVFFYTPSELKEADINITKILPKKDHTLFSIDIKKKHLLRFKIVTRNQRLIFMFYRFFAICSRVCRYEKYKKDKY